MNYFNFLPFQFNLFMIKYLWGYRSGTLGESIFSSVSGTLHQLRQNNAKDSSNVKIGVI